MKKKTLYCLLPLRSITFLLIFTAASLITERDLSDIFSVWSPAATAVNILTILLLVYIAGRNSMTFRKLINLRKGQSSLKKTAAFAALSVVVGMGGMYLAGFICYGSIMPAAALKMISPIPRFLAVTDLLLLPLTAALAEDGLYLGCGAGRIDNSRAAIMLPAFFYAFQHCFIPTLPDARYMAYRFLSFLPLAVIFCICYRKTRDPLLVMPGHILLDLATSVSILAMSFSPDTYERMSSMIK